MIDTTAFRAIVREALGARAVMVRAGETHSDSLSTLTRVIAYLLGAEPNTPGMRTMFEAVSPVIADALPEHVAPLMLTVAAEPVSGVLYTLAPDRAPVTYDRADGQIYRVERTGTDVTTSSVAPTDPDWLTACGYVQRETIGSIVATVSGGSFG